MAIDHHTLIDKGADWASTTTYGGGISAVIFGLTAQEIGIYGGLIIGLLGLVVKLWFEHLKRKDLLQHYREIERKHENIR